MFVSRLRFGLSMAFSLCLLTSACAAPALIAPSAAPDVRKVQLSFLTWNYTGTTPNISWINASTGPLYLKSGKLVDLTPVINATPGFDLADFGDTALAPWKSGDKLVALPFTGGLGRGQHRHGAGSSQRVRHAG